MTTVNEHLDLLTLYRWLGGKLLNDLIRGDGTESGLDDI